MSSNPISAVTDTGIIAILRGDYAEHVRDLADALLAGGVRALEVTMNSPGALVMIADLAQHCGDRMLVGGGTLLTEAQVRQVADAGGRFVVSPDVHPPVIEQALRLGLEPFPGAFTATEVRTALRAGARYIKLFPAMPAGAGYLRQLRGPLSEVDFVPTGGVDADNIPAFIQAGAAAFGVGGSLIPRSLTGAQAELDGVQAAAARLITLIRQTRTTLE